MNKKLMFTIGADPELFLKDSTGKFISSIGLIGGSKETPKDIGEGCAIQEDNVAVEFNIPPATTITEFEASLNYSLTLLQQRAKELNLQLAIEASADFTLDQLVNPAAQRFGCDPDFNAWTLLQNPRPIANIKSLRSCGGHVHIGTTLNIIDVIKAMDLFLGCPSIILDKDNKRRELYGKAGAYRNKPYGVEYRTLSNFWLTSSKLMQWVYKRTAFALNWVADNSKNDAVEWDIYTATAIQECINKGNKDAYMFLDKQYNLGL